MSEIERDIADAAARAVTALETLCTLGFEAEEQLKSADEFRKWFRAQIKAVATAFKCLHEIAGDEPEPRQWVA